MNLFTYKPNAYVDTQVDLPLEFIQGQLETKQKEYNAQSAATDKSLQNFLEVIKPGLSTGKKAEALKGKYLSRFDEINNELNNTGNTSAAAQKLSKLTGEIASDPEVHDINEDYKMTQLFSQGLMEGKYNSSTHPYLFDQVTGKPFQLEPGQRFNQMNYYPGTLTNPVEHFSKMVNEYLKSDSGAVKMGDVNPFTGVKVTTDTQFNELRAQKIEDYLVKQFEAFKMDPKHKAFMIQATGNKPENYTIDMYKSQIVDPVKELAHKGTSVGIDISGGTTTGQGNTNDPNKKVNDILFSITVPGSGQRLLKFGQPVDDPNSIIGSMSDLEKDRDNVEQSVIASSNIVLPIFGMDPEATDLLSDTGWNEFSKNLSKNYVQNAEGHWVPIGAGARPLTPDEEETITQVIGAQRAYKSRESAINYIKEKTGVKDYNPNIIDNAKVATINKVKGAYLSYLAATGQNELYSKFESLPLEQKWELVSQIPNNKLEMNKEMAEQLKGKNEGKIYQAFENYKNRISEIELMYLPEEDVYSQIEFNILNAAKTGQLIMRRLTDNQRIDKGKFDEIFTKKIPYKDGDPSKGIDNTRIVTGFGFDPQNGLIGVISLNGEQFEFDISDDPKTNIDDFITGEAPELRGKLKFYDEVIKDLRNNVNNRGRFHIDDDEYNFTVEEQNVGTDKPSYSYMYDFDGSGQKRATKLSELLKAAHTKSKTKAVINNAMKQSEMQKLTNDFIKQLQANPSKQAELTSSYLQKQQELELKYSGK